MSKTVKKPSDTFDLNLGGETRTLLMSFGLLNELSKVIHDPSVVAAAAIDPDLRAEVLKLVLAERKPSGKILSEFEDVDDIDASLEDIEKLLHWVMDHVLSFFVRLLKSTEQVASQYKDETASLVSSLVGSPDSPSVTP